MKDDTSIMRDIEKRHDTMLSREDAIYELFGNSTEYRRIRNERMKLVYEYDRRRKGRKW